MGRAGIEPATLGLKVQLHEMRRASKSFGELKNAANCADPRCDELNQHAGGGDEPYAHSYAQSSPE
jgi:hypothetical protein